MKLRTRISRICMIAILGVGVLQGCSQEEEVETVETAGQGSTAPALDLTTTTTIPEAGFVITNARILDGMGGEIEQGSIVVEGDRIVSVSEGNTEVPGALVIDAAGMTVMPGFIDAHRHIIQGNPDEWLAGQAEEDMRQFLETGFTTVYSAGDAPQILELRRMTADGEIAGPRILAAAFTGLAAPEEGAEAPGQNGDPARFDNARPPLRPTEAATAIPDDAARAQVQNLVDAGYDGAKNVITMTPNGPEERTLGIMVEEARRLGTRVVTHAVTVMDTMAAVRADVDMLVHTPHIGMITEEEARQVADSGIPMVSTLGIFVPFFDENNEPIFRDRLPFPWDTILSAGQGPVNARLLWEAGVVLGYGTDTTYHPERTLLHELKSLFLVFSEQDILRIMGENAATTIDMQDEIGTLEAGKLADIVFVNGDPLSDLFDLLDVEVVIKEGQFMVDNRN